MTAWIRRHHLKAIAALAGWLALPLIHLVCR